MLRADLDKESGYHIFTIQQMPDLAPVHEFFTHSVADVVGNLRPALDKFVWELACDFAGGTPPDPEGVKFPIADDRAWFDKSKRLRDQLLPSHWEFIREFQPYKGQNGRFDNYSGPYVHQLALLRDLSNDDKHRLTQPILLIPNQFNFIGFQIAQREQTIGQQTVMVLDWETKAVGTELELGAEVLRIRLIDAEPHIDNAGQFTPQVAMAEGRPPSPQSTE